MRVLLSEGSGLTSRQVATRLGALGHHVLMLELARDSHPPTVPAGHSRPYSLTSKAWDEIVAASER